ncbi:MAG: sporulation initiation factor Spo0A C-terminal domain-containing protein [Lachnospiraceae bacterium]|nr:sporulation initiation factor Spo0A C-terminal domain-containing protein [Lachnospiraceae bacterium]
MEKRREEEIQSITQIMLELGMPVHLRGYHYLREAVCISVEDMELVGSVTKLLYPVIAKRYHTEHEKIERAIRSVIEVGWGRGNENLYKEILGYSKKNGISRPTNSEFIAAMADWVRMKER